MTNTKPVLKLTVLSAALLTAYSPTFAADDELAKLITPDSSVSVGIGNWSADRPQQGIYDGMRDKGAKALIDADVVRRDAATGTWLMFSTRNLGLDNRELKAEWLQQGTMGFSLDYNRTSRDNPYTFNTGLQGIGSTTMIISGAGANALPMRNVEIGTHRDQVGLGFYRNLMPGVDLNVTFKNEDKKGNRQWGRGGQPEFIVEPIDANTRQLEAILSYSTKELQLSGGYYGSWYDNAHKLIDTIRNGDNPATLNNHVYLSLPQDNQAHQLFLNGGYAFTPTTRGTFKLNYTHATQNERMPTIDIAGLSWVNAPSKLNGKIDTTQVQLGLASRPTSKLSLSANLNYHNAKDNTPIVRVISTQADGNCNAAGRCVDNTPFSYKTLTGKLEANYRLAPQWGLIAGIDEKRQDRTLPVGSIAQAGAEIGLDTQRYVPFRGRVDETTYRLQLRKTMSDTVNGSLAYLHSARRGSQYSITEAVESDWVTPLHIANRDRNKWRAMLDWTPSEVVGVQFAAEDARDKYPTTAARPYGIRDGKGMLYSIDANFKVNDKFHVTAWYSHDDTRANQNGWRAGRDTAPDATKAAELRDVGNSLGIGLRGTPKSNLKLGADLQVTHNVSKYHENLALLGAGPAYPVVSGVTVIPTPDITSKIFRLALFMDYALRKDGNLRFDLIHERWQTNDWSWQFANGTPFTYGTTTDGSQVLSDSKQHSTFLGVRYIYKFQ